MERPPLDLTLYFVTDGSGKSEGELLETVALACEGGATLIQLREKEKSGREYFELAQKAVRVAGRWGVPLIVDDRLDVAMAAGAAGVHLGQSDLPVCAARRIMGSGAIVGATAKTVGQALRAKAEGADYLGVGAIYPTTTKVVTVITEVSVLDEIAREAGLPVVAIGGLCASNMSALYGSMADGIAVVSAIMKSPDPRAAAAELKAQVLANFKKARMRAGLQPALSPRLSPALPPEPGPGAVQGHGQGPFAGGSGSAPWSAQ